MRLPIGSNSEAVSPVLFQTLTFVHGTICSSDPGPDHRVTIVFGASVISAVKVYVWFAP